MKSIDLKPNFAAATYIRISALESGTPEGKRMARNELMRYARELDRLAAIACASLDTQDTPIEGE